MDEPRKNKFDSMRDKIQELEEQGSIMIRTLGEHQKKVDKLTKDNIHMGEELNIVKSERDKMRFDVEHETANLKEHCKLLQQDSESALAASVQSRKEMRKIQKGNENFRKQLRELAQTLKGRETQVAELQMQIFNAKNPSQAKKS